MEGVGDGSHVIWIAAGCASFFMVTTILIACAEFRRKHKSEHGSEPVQLVYKHRNTDYQEPGVLLRQQNGHVNNSPNGWRNSSLSRELPAIPDTLDGGESASNLYACLDDVRVDPQNLTSQLPHGRVHPYDRIGGPTIPSTSAGQVAVNPHAAHAKVLHQQLENEHVYRGARSDRSYASLTARAPLSDLILSEDENHLYAQVGGEYGGSMESEQLGGSAHIYNELYAEIDALSNGHAHYNDVVEINPYATSASVLQPGPSLQPDPALTDADKDKLYAKVNKPHRGMDKNSFLNHEARNGKERMISAPVATAESIDIGHSPTGRRESDESLRESLNAAIDSMDHSVSGFVAEGSKNIHPQGSRHLPSLNGYKRREHVYEMVPDV